MQMKARQSIYLSKRGLLKSASEKAVENWRRLSEATCSSVMVMSCFLLFLNSLACLLACL